MVDRISAPQPSPRLGVAGAAAPPPSGAREAAATDGGAPLASDEVTFAPVATSDEADEVDIDTFDVPPPAKDVGIDNPAATGSNSRRRTQPAPPPPPKAPEPPPPPKA
ncbi:MAG: hypothetical protein VKS61_00230 [Candidatus Sericytochromatia bacterium]|nr:hypothetical protein [Candidatus Sericytochromatia bacterium]